MLVLDHLVMAVGSKRLAWGSKATTRLLATKRYQRHELSFLVERTLRTTTIRRKGDLCFLSRLYSLIYS